MIKMIKMIGF